MAKLPQKGEGLAQEIESRNHPRVVIARPKIETAIFEIDGTAPYMQCRMSQKAIAAMRAKQALGSQATKGKKREPRNFDADYEGAFHRSTDGWVGVPCAAFRAALIDTCRIAGFKMVMAKMSIFVEPDGFDEVDGMPLCKLIAGEPQRTEMAVRNETGVVDIRPRPMWREWTIKLRIRYDADQFSREDVANLLLRAGLQCGVGEGRAFSKNSYGMGFGSFEIK